MVLKNCGPKGYPGFSEVGNMALPAKLIKKGITDMVRISDARMSGTAYGTVVLHAAPEAAVGGPLALVEDRRSSSSTYRPANSCWKCRTTSLTGAGPSWCCRRRRRIFMAAIASSMSIMSCRQTGAPTSIFWSGSAVRW